MINEVLQAENLLKGEGIGKRCTYQHCYLLARYYCQQGVDPIGIRKNIIKWAETYNVQLTAKLNQIISDAQEDKQELRGNVVIKISDADIQRITEMFDNPKTRRAALAMLCYAKAAGDKDAIFQMSVASFCNWINQDYSYVQRHYMPELKSMGFVERMKKSKEKGFGWDNNGKYGKFRLLVPIKNAGSHVLIDNDIDSLYAECFV